VTLNKAGIILFASYVFNESFDLFSSEQWHSPETLLINSQIILMHFDPEEISLAPELNISYQYVPHELRTIQYSVPLSAPHPTIETT
jgi:hypothetical protein